MLLFLEDEVLPKILDYFHNMTRKYFSYHTACARKEVQILSLVPITESNEEMTAWHV